MGPASSSNNQSMRELHDRFIVIEEFSAKSISYLQEKDTHRSFLLKELTFNDKEEFNKTISKVIAKQKDLEGQQHVVPLTQYFTKTEDNFCSNFYKIYILFEHPHKNLNHEVQERQQLNSKFQQKELWSILASCILGLCHLQNKDIKHQALRSDTILLTSEGSIMVSDPYCTGLQTSYETLLSKRNTPHIYLSPQLCKALQQQKLDTTNINPYKSDVFTMGMIMLQAGLLSYQDDCYRQDNSQIDWQNLQYNIEKFGQYYSHELKAMLQMMLNENEEERLMWVELETYVRSGEEIDSMQRVQTPVAIQQQQNRLIPSYHHPVRQSNQNHNGQGTGVAVTSSQPPVISASQTVSNQPIQSTNAYRQLGGVSSNSSNQVKQFPQANIAYSYKPTVSEINANNFNRPISVSTQPGNRLPINQTAQPQHQHFITNTQAIHRSMQAQSSQSNIGSQKGDSIAPVLINSAKPIFNMHLPTNTYNTLAKTDENMFQEYEEDMKQTCEPDKDRNSHQQSINGQTHLVTNSNLVANNTATGLVNPYNLGIHNVVQHQSSVPLMQIPRLQQLQQPNEGMNTFLPPSMLQSARPLNVSNSTNNNNMRPNPLPPSFHSNVYPTNLNPVSYQSSYFPSSTFSSIPPTIGNYPSSAFPSRPVPYDQPGAKFSAPSQFAQTQFNNYFHDKPIEIGNSTTFNGKNQKIQANKLNNTHFSQVASKALADHDQVHFVKETFKQGSYYEGEKVNGMRCGRGKFYYQDGGLYDGEWEANKMSGQGKLFYQSGKIAYDGAWSDDQFTGYGVLYNETPLPIDKGLDYTNFELADEYWTRFEGEFYNDLKQGPGRLYFSNGEFFQGEFDKDMATGQGVYHRINGQRIFGIWNQNQLERRLR